LLSDFFAGQAFKNETPFVYHSTAYRTHEFLRLSLSLMSGKAKTSAVNFFKLLRESLNELLKNDPLRMAGATAFFTTFALPPILVIIIQSLKLILDPREVRSQLFHSLENIVGREAVEQVIDVLLAIRKLASNWLIIIGGFIFLLFVATTLFKVIKSSINQIWKVRPVHRLSFKETMLSRLISIAIIIIAGVLFVISLLGEGLQAYLGKYVFEVSPVLSFYFKSTLNYLTSIIIVTMWFSILFRYLPDGRPGWKVSFAGGFLTAILFTIGKLILHWMLSYSNINTVYGTSAAIVLLLLFVFYTALILYYGASFTKCWGINTDRPIRPLHHAMHYRIMEAEIETKKADR
jgi:membrane protein